MNIAVGVDVGAPVIVAALVNGNDAVAVINAREPARNPRRWRPISLACCTSRSSTSTNRATRLLLLAAQAERAASNDAAARALVRSLQSPEAPALLRRMQHNSAGR